MEYYVQTQRLLSLYSESNTNVVRHFFSQLHAVRQLYSIAIINAIAASKSTHVNDKYKIIEESITREPYMKNIKLIDIRNVIVFTIRKEFNTVINIQPYISEKETDKVFLELDEKSIIGTNINKLQRLIETCYYINHIFIITRSPEKIQEETWVMCHEYFYQTPLVESVRGVYDLLKVLIHV